MERITYRRELNAPGKLAGIDFSNPKLEPSIRVLVNNLRQEVRSFSPPEGVEVKHRTVPVADGETVECFLLEPQGCRNKLPAMLYCHGGGFFLPIQPMMMELAAQYARELQIRVFVPEYRVLPDHPNPYPFRDCLGVWNWMTEQENVDRDKLLLYGESAGATLAAGISLWQRDHGGCQARGQMLIYPVLDNRCSRYLSMRKYMDAAWSLRSNLAMWQKYLKNGEQGLKEYVVPMRAASVEDLPPTYIEAQQFDILHDEAETFAQWLRDAGVCVAFENIEGSYHGFDADTSNEFVQSVVRQRIRMMKSMLSNETKGMTIP